MTNDCNSIQRLTDRVNSGFVDQYLVSGLDGQSSYLIGGLRGRSSYLVGGLGGRGSRSERAELLPCWRSGWAELLPSVRRR